MNSQTLAFTFSLKSRLDEIEQYLKDSRLEEIHQYFIDINNREVCVLNLFVSF